MKRPPAAARHRLAQITNKKKTMHLVNRPAAGLSLSFTLCIAAVSVVIFCAFFCLVAPKQTYSNEIMYPLALFDGPLDDNSSANTAQMVKNKAVGG